MGRESGNIPEGQADLFSKKHRDGIADREAIKKLVNDVAEKKKKREEKDDKGQKDDSSGSE